MYYWVSRNSRCIAQGTIEPPFELGRQSPQERGTDPVFISRQDGLRRLVFVSLKVTSIPRKSLSVTLADDDSIAITNLHQEISVELVDGRRILPGQVVKVVDEVSIKFADGYSVRLSRHDIPSGLEPPDIDVALENLQASLISLPSKAAQIQAIDLIKSALRAFKEVPGTKEFYKKVVTCVLEMLDVDRAVVLVKDEPDWQQIASAQVAGDRVVVSDSAHKSNAVFSRSLVQRVMEQKTTEVFEPDSEIPDSAVSLQMVHRAVASPIFDEHHDVVAILYADKSAGGRYGRPVGELEAALLEVLAGAVSAGLAREQHEVFRKEASRFFSPRVLDRLQNNRSLLEGRDADVSILFCDIRNFSSISYRVGPSAAIAWINDIFTRLSECVLRNDGVVVNYVGDELVAMFGAPEDQPDHASRACRTALEMLQTMPDLNEHWAELTSGKFGVGVGINSGPARVGNTGSTIKFQYGPLGNTVNVASRVQSLTKQLGVTSLITGATAAAISRAQLVRRLQTVRVVGVPDPFDLYELVDDAREEKLQLLASYAKALELFESRALVDAERALKSLTERFPADTPTRLLLARTSAALQGDPAKFDPVWSFTQK